jgi:hypothetical protein
MCTATCADDCTGSAQAYGGGGGGSGVGASGGSGGGILFKAVKIICTSGYITVAGGNAVGDGLGGSGGSLDGSPGSIGEFGGGGGGGRIKLFHSNPGYLHLIEPTTDTSGGMGASSGGSGTYLISATAGPLDGRKIYQEGGVYKKRMRVNLLDE